MGFLQLLISKDKYSISSTIKGDETLNPAHRTSLIIPIYLCGGAKILDGAVPQCWWPHFYRRRRRRVKRKSGNIDDFCRR